MLQSYHKTFHNSFIGNWKNSHTEFFLGADSQEIYEKNLKTQSVEWVYRNLPISYCYNANGHRCDNISSVVGKNYLLFVGCSHTFGTGLPLDKTYPFLVSQETLLPYYNLALGATGDDTLQHNLIVWKSCVPRDPQALILQWSFIGRALTSDVPGVFNPLGPWVNNIDYHEFVEYGERINFFTARRELVRKQIKSIFNCPIIEVVPQNFYTKNKKTAITESYPENSILLTEFVDKARDLLHGGIETNRIWANQVKQGLQKFI